MQFVKTYAGVKFSKYMYPTELLKRDIQLLAMIMQKQYQPIKQLLDEALAILQSGFQQCDALALEKFAQIFE